MSLPETARAPSAIYLDHAAATPLLPEVAAAMAEVREAGFANPSSPHAAGRRARKLLEDARDRILAIVGADLGAGAGLVFTSGATEANRLGILGQAGGLGLTGDSRGRVLFSARDHGSSRAAVTELEARGWEAVSVSLRGDGTLAFPGEGRGERPDGELLCATLACGQSGSLEDVAALAAWAVARPGRRVHVDATQALLAGGPGSGAFGLPPAAATTLTLAPHKFGGPRGIGGLVVGRDVVLVPPAAAVQEAGLRGGTEAVELAVGFARALETTVADRAAVARRMAALRDRLESRLVALATTAGIAAHVVAAGAPRAPHIATVAFPGLDRQALVMAADLEHVACASGTACASGSSEPAPALVAMGLPAACVAGAVRFSLGRDTTADDVDAAAERLRNVLARMVPRAGG